ncbi:xylulokinase [Bosea sp. PAMC 26642]|uniref:xylulokinase n=1 Tax=Bosea sp. (strain PAMC 26642) TaxID=1792307 RepID=UPI000770466C|nr:xylulokinase [Bosea sp. PAMC 26642]AMJ60032.1 xylulose kinase [Bosea sp. PAMC 26642]
MHFIGIDLGTSAVKAVLVDSSQRVVASGEARLSRRSLHPGWSEQDPDDWWAATLKALATLRADSTEAWGRVTAIGLSGQMHGAVVLDAQGVVLRPAILWNDGRSHEECSDLERVVPELGRKAGVPAMPGFTAPKLLWLRKHEPDVFSRIAHVLLPKDFIRLKLTGEYATDRSDAAGTLWLDQAGRSWSPELVAASGLTLAHMPQLMEGTDAGGSLSMSIARELCLSPGVAVAAGAGDAAAGAIGVGAIDEGDAFLSLGTSAQLFRATGSYRPRPERFLHAYCHALPDRWFQMAAMLNGAACLSWIADVLKEPDIGALLQRTEHEAPRPTGLMFLPYLSGERTPHNDPSARGAFIGLSPHTTPASMVRAVLEGVAFSCLDAKDCLSAADTPLSSLSVIGGGSRSDFWIRVVASAIDLPLTRHDGGEQGPAFGAARLARLAVTGEAVRDVCMKPPVRDVIAPDPYLASFYGERMPRFRDLYARLKGAFDACS